MGTHAQSGVTRRSFLTALGVAGATAVATSRLTALSTDIPMRIGIRDANLQKRADPGAFELAHRAGVQGVEVVINTLQDTVHLRDPRMQQRYRDASHAWGVDIPSIYGGTMNDVPLKSEPVAAIWLYDAIEIARHLGAGVILMAFFNKGELFPRKTEEMDRVVKVLQALAPRAEDMGITLGLEDTLSAADNLRIMERVGSPAIKVYYDVRNSWANGFDCPAEIRLLGNENICGVHLKSGRELLETRELCDWDATAAAFKEISYDGWYILETSSPSGDAVVDARMNVAYVRRTFPVGGVFLQP